MSYLPDPPKQPGQKPDLSFSASLAPSLTAIDLGDVDMRIHTSQTNQYKMESCVGNATADSIELLNSVAGLPEVQVSRLFIYTLARNMSDADGDGRSDINIDKGTFIRYAFEVLQKFGVCREDIPVEQGGWPYDMDKVFTLPSLKAMRAATGHRIHSYYRITETGEDRLGKIVEALRAHHPVVFGTRIAESFKKVHDETPVEMPEGDTVGAHAMMVVGYSFEKGFLIKNSWGVNWGDYGFCWMKPEYLAWKMTQDLWVPTMGTTFR